MTRWVLLRGLTREAGHWGGFQDRLAQQLGGRVEVFTPDLPGSGRRHGERSPASAYGLMQAVRSELPPGPPVMLLALSLGAMVALEWARVAPQEVAGAVLINTSAGGQAPWLRLRPRNYLPLLGLLRPGATADERERCVLALTSSQPLRHAGALARWVTLAHQRPVSTGNAARQLLAAARYRAPVQPPQPPLLLLVSACDRLVSPRCSQDLARRWNLPVRVHPWAGHDLPLDDPDWALAVIKAWVEG